MNGTRCNIDHRGRRARVVAGVAMLAGAAGLVGVGVAAGRRELVVGGVLVGASGGFSVFEGTVGWCAVRALGIPTPL